MTEDISDLEGLNDECVQRYTGSRGFWRNQPPGIFFTNGGSEITSEDIESNMCVHLGGT